MNQDEVTTKFLIGRFVLIICIFVGVIGSISLIGYLYSLTPDYEKHQIDYANKIASMTCDELLTEIENSVPHGFTVGSADTILDRHIEEFKDKGCIIEDQK